jgi:hypothetical protein
MDPVVSAVMVLLWCSPDMLLCRRLPTEAPQPVYMTVSDCESALRARLADLKGEGKIVIGRCQGIGVRSYVISWGISPNRELLTSTAPAEAPEPAATASQVADDDASSRADGMPDYATVRVTRGLGPEAETTSYIVKHSTQ